MDRKRGLKGENERTKRFIRNIPEEMKFSSVAGFRKQNGIWRLCFDNVEKTLLKKTNGQIPDILIYIHTADAFQKEYFKYEYSVVVNSGKSPYNMLVIDKYVSSGAAE